jgi:hypothetical protein
MTPEQRFPVGSAIVHCGRKCIVMRHIGPAEAYHTYRTIGLEYEYADDTGVIRCGVIAERELPALEAQNT